MAKRSSGPKIQDYPRIKNELLADPCLFPRKTPLMPEEVIVKAVDASFQRCKTTKTGKTRQISDTPESLVELCIEHLRTRSDPILSPNFVCLCEIENLFDFDAVSHEMQRHRMTIGVFYQYLILELMRKNWTVFDGYQEGDVVADIETPGFSKGLRLYISVKKSSDTVGGQDFGGVVNRLERIVKQEKNLTRPYLCVFCVATPSAGKLLTFEKDRKIKCDKNEKPYSLNCEVWGPGFVFPYITGRNAREIYQIGIRRAADQLPFLTLKYRQECSRLLIARLGEMGLLGRNSKLDPRKFLNFICDQEESDA
jgi:hypothetical protein